jgi:hypothetical protein
LNTRELSYVVQKERGDAPTTAEVNEWQIPSEMAEVLVDHRVKLVLP